MTPEELRGIQELTQRTWSHDSPCHIGDMAWQRYMHSDREGEWSWRLWEVDGQVRAWGWSQAPGDLQIGVDPAHPELADEVIVHFGPKTVTTLDRQPVVQEALRRNGYTRTDGPYLAYHSRSLDHLPEPVLPPGFTVRAVTADDLVRRVAVHQAAWPGTKVTEQSYRTVMAAWPYRSDLDWVAVAPDGSFAASCLIWLDEANGVGLLEPVGADPRFRRLGLGRAVCLAAMRAVRAVGAREAVVYPTVGGSAHPGALALYRALGFAGYARSVDFRR
ncbi:GNAT family N-acetyltransferase [Kutzneria sp. NPDC052558]|uniref:GNAT family N-acetyltransferase n=1 Tax=Kutzneria sp. NPDC052558 TaxID=3364121 RepID=UPI0037C4F3BB